MICTQQSTPHMLGMSEEKQAIRDCNVNVCDIDGSTQKHNRLSHPENQMDEGNHAFNLSAATMNQSNDIVSFLQIVSVSI